MRYHHFTHMYQKSQSYDVRFLKYGVKQTELYVILGHFLPPNDLENQHFQKMEKMLEDIILLYIHVYHK